MHDPLRNPHDTIREMLIGKEGVAKEERERQIEHERELARIRTESHALVWTGTTEELTDTIRRWYESDFLIAESLQDALQKAAIHFVGTDGKPIIKPISENTAATPKPKKGKISRRDFVAPLLDAKGWSPLDWALEAIVAPATVNDYLDEKTNPYRSTRLKLAKALGVAVAQLPK
jgi:hypothetical protein